MTKSTFYISRLLHLLVFIFHFSYASTGSLRQFLLIVCVTHVKCYDVYNDNSSGFGYRRSGKIGCGCGDCDEAEWS
ncbi:unnamed protein product [Litomosoides sigmodontis]|uniref:Uncharacterized protein n=1 Tax=Litomosoides sigmodontis TaxID=42156 RepID=A0A3P6TTJ3_LITSI|nr:unnamed protein product [Litomosoides sigmodontis]